MLQPRVRSFSPDAGRGPTKVVRRTVAGVQRLRQSEVSVLVDDFELALARDPSSAVRDLAQAEIERARELLSSLPKGVDEAVHEFRKSMKGLRALARLVRGQLGPEFRRCNRALRDAGRLLRELRDEEAVREALRALRTEFLDEDEHAALDRIEHLLIDQHHGRGTRAELTERIGLALHELSRASGALGGVVLASYGDVERGLDRTYRSARRCFRELDGEHDDITLHELRKRIKDLRFHLDLLGQSAPAVLATQSHMAGEASELLGQDHDLVLLTLELDFLELGQGDGPVVERLIARRRAELQGVALQLCVELLREKPKRRTARVLSYLPGPPDSRSHAST
jgi:CHAD domain-containing protein